MLLDANILIFAADSTSPFHARTSTWLEHRLEGTEGVGFPWQSLITFIRLGTHPHAFAHPMTIDEAYGYVADWLDADVAWIPAPGPRYSEMFRRLLTRHGTRGDLVPDAALAALALEQGLPVASADTDFARFTEIEWVNPLAA